MEPTSSPDNARSTRGLARFWPATRDAEDEAATPAGTGAQATPTSETEMVALGSRRAAEADGSLDGLAGPTPVRPPLSPFASAAPGPGGPAGSPGDAPRPLSSPAGPFGGPGGPSAPANGGPANGGLSDNGPGDGGPGDRGPASPAPVSAAPAGGLHEAADRDPDHSGVDDGEEPGSAAVESAAVNPWDRDPGSFGGFDLGGRNGRFLFGGHQPAESPAGRNGLNGHGPGATNGVELNGRTTGAGPDTSAVQDPGPADRGDENGRDDMNGRSGIPGVPGTDEPDPATPVSGPAGAADDPAGHRAPDAEQRRQAAGWASVPTTTHPVVSPTSGVPTSGAPASAAPVSPARGFGYGQPPAYTPALPDPAAGPVSGVPAPRAAAASIPVPAAPPVKPPAGAGREDTSGPVGITFGHGGGTGPAPADEDDSRTSGPRRSASLEDAEPVRRGRRAAPDEPAGARPEDAPLRPGDVAAGHIAFWDDDATRHFRAAWHEVKAEFVDDPVAALTRAHDLLTDAVNELTEALLAERDELDPLRGDGTPDTESMRMAMRGYREFLDRILAL